MRFDDAFTCEQALPDRRAFFSHIFEMMSVRGLTKSRADELYRLYHHTTIPLTVTARKWGLSLAQLRSHIRKEGWPSRRLLRQAQKLNPDERPKDVNCVGLAQCTERPALIGRVWAAALAQISELERRTRTLGSKRSLQNARTSDDARAIAILVRTLKELMTLDAQIDKGEGEKNARQKQSTPHAGDAGDAKGWSALAEDLARRLDGLRKRRLASGSSGRSDGPDD